MFGRILVASDGSAPARRACSVAATLAGRFHAHLTVAVVRPPPKKGTDPYLESLVPEAADGKTLSEVVEEVQRDALEQGAGGFDSVTLRGEVPEALLEWLKQKPYDLVVVGSRGLSRGQRILLGSVSLRLASEAPCPVLVVRGRNLGHASRPSAAARSPAPADAH